MKRRLTSAYDHMTMPDACAHRIEQRLQQEVELRKTDRYTKVMSPSRTCRGGWAAAVAAVCMLLILSVGGTMLFLNTSQRLLTAPPETESTVLSEDQYTVATDIPAVQIEAFAKVVRYCILEENWEGLSDRISYPVTIQDQRISDKKTFVEWMELYSLNPVIRKLVKQETCTTMFCSQQGIAMADGFLWINEVNGELKITAINVEIWEEVLKKDQEKRIPEVFAEIISGDRVKMVGVMNQLTIDEYCANWQEGVKLNAFAVVDMDADGVCELVFSLTDEQEKPCGNMVLRQEGNEICGYPFRPGEMLDLKKDGTFFRGDREHHLIFNDKTSWYTEEVKSESEKPLAQWHSYPCQNPDLLLRSYEYVTGTGQSLLPGNPYYHFEGLVLGSMGNNWNLQKEQLLRYGMVCVEDEGTVSVFDPDAPGTALYGTLTNENGVVQFSELGYYICTEEKEYVAEVRNMLSEEPEYWVDAHLPALGSMGRRVFSPEELTAYFGYTPMPDEKTLQEKAAVRELIDGFIRAWAADDTETMKTWLTEDYRGSVEGYPGGGEVRILNYVTDPQRAMEVGENFSASAGVWMDGENNEYWCNLELVKQEKGWKIQSFRIWQSS